MSEDHTGSSRSVDLESPCQSQRPDFNPTPDNSTSQDTEREKGAGTMQHSAYGNLSTHTIKLLVHFTQCCPGNSGSRVKSKASYGVFFSEELPFPPLQHQLSEIELCFLLLLPTVWRSEGQRCQEPVSRRACEITAFLKL